MKFFMGMAQAIFGLIWFGFVALFVVVWIGITVTNTVIDYFKKVNKEFKIEKGEDQNE